MFLSPGTSTRFARRTRVAAVALAAGACLFGASAASAAITFEFEFSTAGSVGFNNPTEGAARRAALVQAGMLFSDLFSSQFTNAGTLRFDVTSEEDFVTPTLASAGSYGTYPAPGFGNGEVVRNKLLTGVDLTGPSSDGNLDVNFGVPWQLDPNVPAATSGPDIAYDFYSALFHEFTHALGFSNNIVFAGNDGQGTGNNGVPGSFSKYDQFLTNAAGQRIIDGLTFMTNQATWDGARTSGVFFNGANAVAANGGNLVDLYSPATFSDGSSIAHLNDTAAYATSLMKFDRDVGPESRRFNAIEIGVLTDLGYTAVVAVPEPASVALMLAGLVGVVGCARRRRTA